MNEWPDDLDARLLEILEAGDDEGPITPGRAEEMSDESLLDVDGIGPGRLRAIRDALSDVELVPVVVFSGLEDNQRFNWGGGEDLRSFEPGQQVPCELDADGNPTDPCLAHAVDVGVAEVTEIEAEEA